MGLPKCRLDVWYPRIQTVDSQGGISSVELLNAWVKCDTAEDISINLKRANALTSVEIEDSLYSPRVAHLSLMNKPRNFRAFDTDTYDYQYHNSGGGNQGSALKLRTSWGPLSRFFKEFLHVRVVDLETHMVLFAGQIYKIKNRYEGQRGAYIELDCRDSLQLLKDIKLKNLVKGVDFPAGTRRSDVIQKFVSLGYEYLPARGDNDPDLVTLTPTLSSLESLDLSSSALTLNSDDNNTGVVANNSYHRFEKSEKAMTVVTKWKASKSGSDNLLQEMARWAVLEPHEDETEIDQFGYDFFADPNIGQAGLNHTVAPRPQMLNYYKRGNRLSSAGSANQQADVYGLTVKLPVLGSAVPHQGATQHNVGTLGGAISSSITYIPVPSAGKNYAGQVITIDSEQLLVKKILSPDEGGNEILNVIRGWDGSAAASHSNSTVVKEIRPAHAVMHQSFDFEDADDELYTEAVLEYVESVVAGNKQITKERSKRFEILYVTEISGQFAWSGKKFDDQHIADADVGPGIGSADEFVLRKPDGTVLTNDRLNNAMGRIQYQSEETVTGSTNFAYILISDLDKDFPTANDASDAYVEIRGLKSPNRTCRVNLNATEAIQGRPATAWAGGNTSSDDGRFFRKVLSISRKNADEVDDLRAEVASRLARATNPLQRGSFQMSKAPYYWYDGIIRSEVDVTAGQNITVKAQNGTTGVQLTNYGIREGMVVHKMTADYAGIAQANSKDVYGYITALTGNASFTVDLSESQTFADDDLIRIFIPLRAGDTVKVDNILANIYGEHLITELSFTEDPQPRTSFDTIGENEPRIRLKFGGVSRAGQSVWNQMLTDKVTTTERITRSVIPVGNQTFTWDGTWTFPDYNTITWAGNSNSNVTLADGTTYQVVDGSTNDSTYGLGTDMATGTAYVLYLDPEGENPNTNAYHIYTRSEADFIQDEDKLLFMFAAPTTADIGKPNCVKGPNFQTDFAFPHSSLNADGKATVSATSSQPTSPALGDIWIDTTTTNSFQRWNGSDWVEYDLGLAAATGAAAQSTANTANSNASTAQNTANAKRTVFQQGGTPDENTAPTALAAGDLWYHTDGAGTTYGQKIFSASAAGYSNWNLRDDAGAINNATTNIEGGRIETQTIILKSGGAGNPNNDNSILSKDAPGDESGNVPAVADHVDNASRLTLSNTGIYGYNSGGNFQFKITTADGKGTFGGGNCFLDAEGLTMEAEGTPITFEHDTGRLQMWGGDNQGRRYIYFNSRADDSGGTYQTDPELNYLAPHLPGRLGLGHRELGPWGTIYANIHYLNIRGSAPGTLDSDQSSWGAMYIRGTTVYVKIGSTEHTVSGGSGGGGGVALGDSPTWTGVHNFNGEVSINDDLTVGNASGDTLTIYSTMSVLNHSALFNNGASGTPGIKLVGDGTNIAGMYFEVSGGFNYIRFPTKGGTGAGFYQSSSSGNGIVAGTGSFTGLYASGTIALSGTSTFTGRVNLDYATYASATLTCQSALLVTGNFGCTAADSKFTGLATSGTATNYVAIQSNGTLIKLTSSERYKKNIRDLEIDSTQIYNLVPKSFEYKSDDTTSFGYIAETVDTMLPSIVMRQEDGTPESINYAHINVLLVEELKKLKARIEVLEGN